MQARSTRLHVLGHEQEPAWSRKRLIAWMSGVSCGKLIVMGDRYAIGNLGQSGSLTDY